jgi:AraC-like DNA-binding protein
MGELNDEASVLKGISTIVDPFMREAWQGRVGVQVFDKDNAVINRNKAYKEAIGVLYDLNSNLGTLAERYWHTLQKLHSAGRLGIKENGAFYDKDDPKKRNYGIVDFFQRSPFEFEHDTESNAVTNETVDRAAEKVASRFTAFATTISNLFDEVKRLVLPALDPWIETFRNFVATWIAKYFPAFALKESERAQFINQKSLEYITQNIGYYETTVTEIANKSGFGNNLEGFVELYKNLTSLKPKVRNAAVRQAYKMNVDMDYVLQKAPFIEMLILLQQKHAGITAELEKIRKNPNHPAKAINAGIDISPSQAQLQTMLHTPNIREAIINAGYKLDSPLSTLEEVVRNILTGVRESSEKLNRTYASYTNIVSHTYERPIPRVPKPPGYTESQEEAAEKQEALDEKAKGMGRWRYN